MQRLSPVAHSACPVDAGNPGRALLLDDPTGDTDLHKAVKEGNLRLVEDLIISRRFDPDNRGKGGMTPLH
ncbi:unnamed protein product [Scytosiphon promiscuus]